MSNDQQLGQNRMAPLLVLLLGLAITALTFERIRATDEEALRADLDADAAQLGLIVQSLANGLETDLISTAEVALVTDGDVATYRDRAGVGSGDRALLSLDPDPRIVTVAADDPEEVRTMEASIRAAIEQPGVREQLTGFADSGSFGFVPLNDDTGVGSLLLAAGARDVEHAFVEVRLFDLRATGPQMTDVVDGIETFAIYVGTDSATGSAVLASTDDLPLTGKVANTTIEAGGQTLFVEVTGSVDRTVSPWTILAAGGFLSTILGALLYVSQHRRDRAIEALTEAQQATEARARLEADLQQSQRMEAVGQLAAGIAHDFNNLLAAITSTVELVSDDVTDPRTREDLDEIRHAARRGAALTRRLLSFGRRDVQAREPLDLNEVIGDVSSLLRRSLREDITLDLRLATIPVPILGDRGEIEQVLLNLVVNARDSADGPSHHITVTTDVEGDRAVLAVRDTGAGMAPEVVERAFEPFYSTKPSTDGTGLGLAIVYGIVQRMEGEVRIESTPGQGTVVQISLPLDSSNREVGVHEGPAAASSPVADGGRLILLVEDEATVRRSTKRLLERAGHRVVDVADGVEAIAAVEDGLDPELVLTDVVLPGSLNGRDVANRVRQMVPTTRIVFASGYPSEVISRQQLIDDAAAFLPKPFDAQSLLAVVESDAPVAKASR